MKTVFVTGADRNIGLEISREFLRRGWFVYAGRYIMDLGYLDELKAEYPETMQIVDADVASMESLKAAAEAVKQTTGTLDMVVHNAAAFGDHAPNAQAVDFSRFWIPYNVNALGAMRLVQAFMPLMQQGMKRLCFVSSEAGVVSVAHRTEVSSYCMSKTALNMALRLMFNQLQPEGWTFRLFHPGWVRSAKDGRPARGGKFEPWEAAASAVPQFIEDREWEDRMVLIDNEDAAWPF
ncbi:MAG: SDR family NAD(P)-dependent oxidoreductase [Clostridia bacterium]|nr:SDR family NAD(P)-dependent oxidoreductase [Clostridia bacterium]